MIAMKKKLIIALAITIIVTFSVTGCTTGKGSNPAGEAVVSENIVSEDAVSENTVSEDAVPLPESGNGEIEKEENEEFLMQENEESVSQETEENTADAQIPVAMAPSVYFVPWEEAGLEDHVMDWQDENLEAAMRKITGIADGDIMLSDVWEITELDIIELDLYSIRIYSIDALGELVNMQKLNLSCGGSITDISALSGLTNLNIWI